MSENAVALPINFNRRQSAFLRQSGMVAFLVFLTVVLVLVAVSPNRLNYFDLSTISASATTLALAGIGETIVVLGGGLDLSPGAVISLVNVILVTQLGASTLSVGLYTVVAAGIAIGIGAAIGAINGLLVSYLRLPSIIVTLATMFVVQGASLLILKYPGGTVSSDFANLLVGDVVPDVFPVPILIIGLGVLVWLYLRRLRFGIGLYAIGSDAVAARASRVDVRFTRFLSFTIAGAFFGWAGLFITANAGSGDPLIGAAFLLKVFTAVVLGGTLIGGGRGGSVGTVFGALTLTIVVDIFLVMGVRTYYVPIVEGAILLLAVIGIGSQPRLPDFGGIKAYWSRYVPRSDRSGQAIAQDSVKEESGGLQSVGWLSRNAHTLRFVLPAYAILIVVLSRDRRHQRRRLQGRHLSGVASHLWKLSRYSRIGPGRGRYSGRTRSVRALGDHFPGNCGDNLRQRFGYGGDMGNSAGPVYRRCDRSFQRRTGRWPRHFTDHRHACNRQHA